MKEEINKIEAVVEEQNSAWVEQTSSGKMKFGCKSYKTNVPDAIKEVVEGIKTMKAEIEKLEP